MIIQVNKRYINAIGEVIFIHEEIIGLIYPFRDVKDYGYIITGKYLDNDTDSEEDLICECNTDILNKYTDEIITQKEFIQQHIEYWNKNESIIN